jgi:hypothetical protein
MCIGLHVQKPFFGQILMKLEFSRRVFAKYSSLNFSWKSIQWERCGRTDMTKLIVALRNFADASNNDRSCAPPPTWCFRFVDREGITSLLLIRYFGSFFCVRFASLVFGISLLNSSMRSDECSLFPWKERESNISTMW